MVLGWFCVAGLGLWLSVQDVHAIEPRQIRFERIVIDEDFPGAYQVETADVDGDGRRDIIALGGDTVAWYQNPSWEKRIVVQGPETDGVISSAAADLDSDGKAEIAIAYDFAMNEPWRGKLALAVQDEGEPRGWRMIALGEIPSIHRVRWGHFGGGRLALVAAPIFGSESRPPTYEQDLAHLWVVGGLTPAGLPEGAELGTARTDWKRPVWHAIAVVRDGAGAGLRCDTILTADNLGVAALRVVDAGAGVGLSVHDVSLVRGWDGPAPNRGCSEVHWGRLADGRRFLGTIEPWHGSRVVVSITKDQAEGSSPGSAVLGEPVVLDDSLDQGHALWVADVDGDGDDEVFAGHRGKDHRVSMYDFEGAGWRRRVIDRDIAAQDLRGGDLDGDGVPEVVAVGGATKNVVIYRVVRD